MCDGYRKNFDDFIQKNSINDSESTQKRKYHRMAPCAMPK